MLTDVSAIALREPRIGNYKAFFYINDKNIGIACVKFILRVTQNLKSLFPLGFKQLCRLADISHHFLRCYCFLFFHTL